MNGAARRVRIIINPSARSGRGPRALRGLQLAGLHIAWVESRSGAHLQDLVREACSDAALDAVGVAGGDGTVALAAGALGDARLPLFILPVGSGNDFAKDIGVPLDVRAALRLARDGAPRRIDLADAAGTRVCCVASVGLDAEALRVIHGSWLPRSRLLNIYGALRGLCSYRPQALRVRWEGGSYEGPVMFAAVTNTRSYGGGFLVSPDAAVDDGALDLCLVRGTGRLQLLGKFPKILRGTHRQEPEVLLARSPMVHMESLGAPLPVCLDGELPTLQTPLELRCLPGALRVLAP